jgi:hypothetical protein
VGNNRAGRLDLSSPHAVGGAAESSIAHWRARNAAFEDAVGRIQDVPEGKSGKNRLHIDIHSETGDLDKLVARLEELRATRIRELDKGPAVHWWIMQDPEGNEFCAT